MFFVFVFSLLLITTRVYGSAPPPPANLDADLDALRIYIRAFNDFCRNNPGCAILDQRHLEQAAHLKLNREYNNVHRLLLLSPEAVQHTQPQSSNNNQTQDTSLFIPADIFKLLLTDRMDLFPVLRVVCRDFAQVLSIRFFLTLHDDMDALYDNIREAFPEELYPNVTRNIVRYLRFYGEADDELKMVLDGLLEWQDYDREYKLLTGYVSDSDEDQ